MLAVSPERLKQAAGTDGSVAAVLSAAKAAMAHVLCHRVRSAPVISTSVALRDYLQLTLAPFRLEQARVLYLDTKNRLICDETVACGTVNDAVVYPRLVIKRALELDAAGLILAHNHPSGDTKPSPADMRITRAVAQAGRDLDILLHDHLIVGRDGYSSFRALGLL